MPHGRHPVFPGLSCFGLRPSFGSEPAAPRPDAAPPALGRFLPALLAALGPTWRPGPSSLTRGSAGWSAVGLHEDGLAAELGRRVGLAPGSKVTVRRGPRPRVWPQQPPQTLWAAAAALASELRPSLAPRPPAPSGPRLLSLAPLGAHSREAL